MEDEALNKYGENIEMHDSALFDVIIDFYDGTKLKIPQEIVPPDWQPPF